MNRRDLFKMFVFVPFLGVRSQPQPARLRGIVFSVDGRKLSELAVPQYIPKIGDEFVISEHGERIYSGTIG